ncbi:MAG: glycosyltransferase [Gammaproteobacteria bacterium]|nr:glycosyltransferase [Gammaproteobacteria bacterium]MBT8123604.1 glycosyltransferase [Gammaproteobacteria bacterium]
MKIQFIHNYYQRKGGEDNVVANEVGLLESKGHDVQLYSVHNDQIFGLVNKVKTVLNVNRSRHQELLLYDYLSERMPDVVHVHNFFPLITPVVFDVCRRLSLPSVMTLHNYRLICAGGMLMRNEVPCELCLTGSAYQAVRHKCYKNSIIGSATVSHMVNHHKTKKTWETKVTRFIALTEFARSRFVKAGFPEERVLVKPNFIEADALENSAEIRQGALFVGRVSGEKGVTNLVEAWEDVEISLTIAGDGPLLHSLPRNARIHYAGSVPHDRIIELMRTAEVLIVPSLWYEGFPMVLVEAFSQGLPVIASRLGGLAEVVEHGVTGLHFEAGDAKDLAKKVRWMYEHPEERRQMGVNARRVYETKYTAEQNYLVMMEIYQQAIDDEKSVIL